MSYLLACHKLLDEQVLFCIKLDQDILRQALAEDREEGSTIMRKISADFFMELTINESSGVRIGLSKMRPLYVMGGLG